MFRRLVLFALLGSLTTLLPHVSLAEPDHGQGKAVNLSSPLDSSDMDPYGYLEEVEGGKALDFVKTHNQKSLDALTKDPRYAEILAIYRKNLMANDKIPFPDYMAPYVYNFWQDKDHVQGIWRRVLLKDYGKPNPPWEIVLDLDALSAKEGKTWVMKGSACLPPKYTRCLINLSNGGGDAVAVREFDTVAKKFVASKPFNLPEAKSDAQWLDENTLLIGTDFGPGSMTSSGYANQVRIWRRGTPWASAKKLYEGKLTDVSSGAGVFRDAHETTTVVMRSPSFFESEIQIVKPNGQLEKLPFPNDADFKGIHHGQALALLRSPWKVGDRTFAQGALVSIPVKDPKATPSLVMLPDARSSIERVVSSGGGLYVKSLHNVKGEVQRFRFDHGSWSAEHVALPENSNLDLLSADPFNDVVFASAEGFLQPRSVYQIGGGASFPKLVRQAPRRFDASDLTVEQLEAVSKDGTKVPYFVVHAKGMELNGKTPTLLTGYGGFEVSESPYYLDSVGSAWLRKGGAFALANIRGGGEFGPAWHEAAIKDNRQRAYDDFAAISQDLQRRSITSPQKLGIMGGSNGGLLMGVALTQHPELYNAVVAQVPLLDMLRYNKLLAGASWMGEYGDPSDPKMAAVLRSYSPYHNVKPGVTYPKSLFLTSTKDDRVHPGHARKMVAKMEDQGHDVLLFENTEGGHGGAANLEQRARMSALQWTFLHQQLFGAASGSSR